MTDLHLRTPTLLEELADHPGRHVHVVFTSAASDVLKQLPLHAELRTRGHAALLVHAPSHGVQDSGRAMLTECGMEPDAEIPAAPPSADPLVQIAQATDQLITALTDAGKKVVPHVLGGSAAAMAAAAVCCSRGFPCVRTEAGTRTLTPKYRESGRWDSEEEFDVSQWYNFLQELPHWERGSMEPFPEQYYARSADAAAGLHLAPHILNQEFLLSEGFAPDRVSVTGHTIADVVRGAGQDTDRASIFQAHPLLTQGSFIRFAVHRPENCRVEHRFRAIYDALVSLVRDGRTVLLTEHPQTEAALERLGLTEEVARLADAYPNFLLTPAWPRYTDILAVMSHASVCATDSSTLQEELSVLGVPCVTLRFGTDRAETALNGSSILAPPVSAGLIRRIIDFSWDNEYMRRRPKIYGEGAAEKCVDAVVKALEEGELLRTEEDRLRVR